MERFAPPDRQTMAADVAALVDLTAAPGREPPPTIAVLAHQPSLLGPFLGWAAALALNGALPKADHELLALRASWWCRSAFEWGEHVEYARAAGLSDDDIARLGAGPEATGWSARQAALLRAADELHAGCALADGTWAALAAQFEPAELVEIPYVVGQYTMLSMVANAFGIAADPGHEPLPDAGTGPTAGGA